VEPVDILGEEGEGATLLDRALLELGEGDVARVGLGVEALEASPVVPPGDEFGVGLVGLGRGEGLGVELGPEGFHGPVAAGIPECGDLALGADA